MLKAYQQGDFTGLCGLYAVLNALQHSMENDGPENLFEDLFKAAAGAIPKKRFPDVLWDGLDIDELDRIARAACEFLLKELGFQFDIWRPFEKRRFKTSAAFIDALDDLWRDRKVSLLLGIEGIRDHWTVLKEIGTDRLSFSDSDGLKTLSRHAISLKGQGKNLLCPRETLAFHLVSIGGEAIPYPRYRPA